MIRRIIPQTWKLRLKLMRRAWADVQSGARSKFARGAPGQTFPHSITLQQPMLNATTEQSRVNKVHNIKLASFSIEAIEIKPGEIFSFWQTAGEPSQKNNFKKGINIIRGEIVEAYGGGLCQLSSIMYHLSLIAGLTVLERSNHSVDLYHDKERYTPLGADCAVFYGYKDFRFRNDYDQPVRFRFQVTDENLTCHIDSQKVLPEHAIQFETIHEDAGSVTVATKNADQTIAQSHYQKA